MRNMPLESCSVSHLVFANLFLLFLYIFAGELGLYATVPGTNVSPLWAPAGVALAGVLVCGYRMTPAIFLGSFWINFNSLPALYQEFGLMQIAFVSCIIGIGAALQAAFGAFLIQYFIRLPGIFATARTVFAFLLFSAVSCLVSSNIAVITLALNKFIDWSDYAYVWWTWWAGDTAGIFVVTPFILVWRHPPRTKFTLKTLTEIGLIGLAIAAVTWLDLMTPITLIYLFIPILVWATIRFHFYGATLTHLLVIIIIVLEAIHDSGLFTEKPLNETLLYLALYITFISGMILMLAAELDRKNSSINRWKQY